MNLNDVGISKRLIFGFLCIVLLMAGLAGFSITQVGSISVTSGKLDGEVNGFLSRVKNPKV